MLEVVLALLLIIALLAALVILLYRRLSLLETKLTELASEKQSQSTRYGLLAEQWLPLSSEFPFDARNFRFIGSPIDGIVFEDDRIIFCEFKFANSKLTEKERRIKELVEKGKVEWFEFKAKEC